METSGLDETTESGVLHTQRELKFPSMTTQILEKAVLFLGMSIGVLKPMPILGNDRIDVT